MNRKPYIALLLVTGILALLDCANLAGAGGGSDVGNGIVTGNLTNDDGSPAAGVVVTLVPYLHNPATDDGSCNCMKDTTDENGTYTFSLTANGTYNIQAMNPEKGTQTLLTQVQIRLNKMLYLPQHQLVAPGIITIYLPKSIDTVTGYLYIQGTTLWTPLSKAKKSLEGEFIVQFDSVPATTVPVMKYVFQGATEQSMVLSDSTPVLPNSVSVIDAFIFWKQFTVSNSALPSDAIRDIQVLPDGSQWFATAGGVVRVANQDWTIFSTANSPLPSNDVLKISYEKNMTVWFATSRGAASFGADQWTCFNPGNSGLPSSHITDILIDPWGNKWFSTFDAGVAKHIGSLWFVHNSNNSPLHNTVYRMIIEDDPEIPNWVLWCATPVGATFFNGTIWKVFSTQNSGILEDTVTCMTSDHAGNKWFGHKNGISLFSQMTWTVFRRYLITGLTSPVTAIAEDNNGTMWFGTQSGVIKYTGTTWVPCTGKRYRLLEHAKVNTLFIDAHDNKWVGTADNGIIVFGPDEQSGNQDETSDPKTIAH